MWIEFKLYKAKEGTSLHKTVVESYNNPNEFIIIGEERLGQLDCYKVHNLGKDGVKIFGDFVSCSMLCPKKDLKLTVDCGYETMELDIDDDDLTVKDISEIKRLNDL